MLTYFALTFAISWGGMLLVMVAVPGGFPGTREQVETRLNFAMLAWTAGPPLAGILLTGLLYGREGFRNLLTRMTRWRVGARWYAVALLSAPLLFMVVPFALSLTFPEFLPGIFTSEEKTFLLLFGIGWGLIGGGFLKELGWTGFAVPTLLRMRYGILGTGLILGVLWGALHFPVFFFASDTYSGALPLVIYLPAYLIILLVGDCQPTGCLWSGSTIVLRACSWRYSCMRVTQPARSSSVLWPVLGRCQGHPSWLLSWHRLLRRGSSLVCSP